MQTVQQTTAVEMRGLERSSENESERERMSDFMSVYPRERNPGSARRPTLHHNNSSKKYGMRTTCALLLRLRVRPFWNNTILLFIGIALGGVRDAGTPLSAPEIKIIVVDNWSHLPVYILS